MKQAHSMALRRTARVLALGAVFATLLLIGLALGSETALAAPQLDVQGSCEPGAVRPGPAVMTCTVLITNSGDEIATNVRTSLGPSASCNLPNPAIPPLIYLYVDGVLQPDTSLPLSSQLGELGPGESVETVTQIAVRNLSAGRVGAELGVSAQGVARVETDLCWTIDPSASDPPTDVSVTKTLVSPPPGNPPGFNAEAVYDIVVANTGSQDVTSLTLIDIISPGLELLAADPAASGSDALGRPTWDLAAFGLASLAPGAEVGVTVTLGSPGDECTNADNQAVVQATVGGVQQDHVAFVDRTAQLGDCSQPEFCLYWAPGEENAAEAPCDEPVCWSLAPGGEYYQPAYDCEAEYCWFSPPGEGSPALNPCDEEVCWISYSEGDVEYFYNVGCDEQFCEYIAPDGSESVTTSCDAGSFCWSEPPEGGRWELVYGCGEFGEACWATPPYEGGSVLYPCDQDPCYLVPPPGVITFGGGDGDYPTPCEFASGRCWPVPAGGGEVVSYTVQCEDIEFYCIATPPGGGVSFVLYCDEVDVVCWGLDEELAGYLGLPPETLIPRFCEAGETPTIPYPAVGVTAEVEPGTLTPAEFEEGTVESVEPLPSAGAEAAILEPSSRVEEFDGPPPPPDDDDDNTPPLDTTSPPGDDDDEPPDRLEDVLGLTKPPPANIGAPDSGYGPDERGSSGPWIVIATALAAAGLMCCGGGVFLRRRA